jgi:NodT family efflux transporter outer membrane factor (OMF) lipoprotein
MSPSRLSFNFGRSVLAWGALALAGCAPLPAKPPAHADIVQPELQQTWAAATADPAFEQAARPPHAWWNAFNDHALNTLIETALRGNPRLAVVEARIAQAQQAAHQVQIDAGVRYESDASVVREHFSENGLYPPPLGGATTNQGDISVGASYTLDWWGKNRALLQSAVGERRALEAEQGAVELALAGEVADAYFAWEDVAVRMKLARQALDTRRESLQLAKSRLAHGLDFALTVSRMERLLAGEQDEVRALETQSRILRDQLSALTGNGPDWGAKLEEPVASSAGAFPLPQKLPLDWLAQRPDLMALEWRTSAAASRIAVARAEFYPNVDMNLFVGLQSLDISKWFAAQSWEGSLGPAVHIPLFNVKTLNTRLDAREAEYDEAAAQYNQTLLQAAGQVADALSEISGLAARVRLQRAATASAEQAQKIQATRFENGLTDRAPTLEEEMTVLAQRAQESKLEAEHKRAMAALFVAIGGTNAASQEEAPHVGSTHAANNRP